MSVKISVIICTLNRPIFLSDCIKSLNNQTLSQKNFEIIIVESYENSASKQIIKNQPDNINIKFFELVNAGLSEARNFGFSNAMGDIITYIDDDAVADKKFLENILITFEEKNLKIGCVGGKIIPTWEGQKPDWLSSEIESVLTILDISDRKIILNGDQFLAGANISFSKEILQIIGGFPQNLGRYGDLLLSNEEIYLQILVNISGYQIIYDPKIIVYHFIPIKRLTKKWFLKRYFWQGISTAVLYSYPSIQNFKNQQLLKYKLKKNTIALEIFYFLNPFNNQKAFALKCTTIAKIGYVVGLVYLFYTNIKKK